MHTYRIEIGTISAPTTWPFICTPKFIERNGSGSTAKVMNFFVGDIHSASFLIEIHDSILYLIKNSTFGWFEFYNGGEYEFKNLLRQLELFCFQNHLTKIIIKLPPQSQVPHYALLVNQLHLEKYTIEKTEVNSIVEIGKKKLSKGRKYEINKASKQELIIHSKAQITKQEYSIILENLKRHNTAPLHTLECLNSLKAQFPDKIEFFTCYAKDIPESIVITFDYGSALHSQYIASTSYGHASGLQDMLINHLVTKAHQSNKNWSFGISNEPTNNELNIGLYRYKKSFGATPDLKQVFSKCLKL